MDKQTKEDIRKYEQLKIEIKELKDKADDIKERLIPKIDENQEINCEYGIITKRHYPSYQYSEEIEEEKKKLKKKKKEEVAKGIAVDNGTDTIVYKLNKK